MKGYDMDCKKDPETGEFKCILRKKGSPLEVGSFTVVRGDDGLEVTAVKGDPDLVNECANQMMKYFEFEVKT